MTDPGFQVPPGCIAFTTYGPIEATTFQSSIEMRAQAERMGLTNINWITVPGHLVDKARNEACRAALKAGSSWLFFIDADMSFEPNLLEIILRTSFGDPGTRDFDIIGGWAQLRGSPYIATIDKGSGTWEPMDAHIGPLEVIRTGGACLLIKRHVLERMAYPWFGTRAAPRPLDTIAELDNYTRIKFDGKNPFSEHPAWDLITKCAAEDGGKQRQDALSQNAMQPGWDVSTVGEDSGFCDRAKALGFRILVQTDAVTHHLERRPITPDMHNAAIKEVFRNQALMCGVLE